MHEIYKKDQKPFIIPDGNRYKVIKTKQFIFLNQMWYFAARTLLSSFIIAYDAKESKSHFLYK